MREIIVKYNDGNDHMAVRGGEYVQDLVRCGECMHRPIKEDEDGADHGFNLRAPNMREVCPCLVDDGWYSWMPEDDFFCGYGEVRDE